MFGETVVLMMVISFLAGMVKGLAGFGFSMIGTSLLAMFIPASQAVTLFIIPLMVVQLELLNQLSWKEFKSCGERFEVYIISALLGTVAGLLLLRSLPEWPIEILIGSIALGYGVLRLEIVDLSYGEVPDRFVVSKKIFEPVIGVLSGIVFGATNIGVQFVAYLKTKNFSRSVFLGVLAMVVLGISAVRVALSWQLGLYQGISSLYTSIGIAAIGATSVLVFVKIGDRIPRRYTEILATTLLIIVGTNLIISGAGIY